MTISATRRLTAVALLGAVGIALFVLESYVPMPVPFLKIGLANISSVVALLLLGTTAMLSVVLLRIVVGSLLVGTFLGPAFVLAITAGVVSALAMAVTKLLTRNLFSALGLSLIGSMTHIAVQLLVVRFLFVQNAAVFRLFPLLLLTGLVGGLVVGWISVRLVAALHEVRL